MSPLISTIISSLVPVFTDKLSKTAGWASVLYAINLGVVQVAKHLETFVGVPHQELSVWVWVTMVVLFLIIPADYLESRIRILKYFMEQLGKTR